jgi:hypothetical protein
MTVAQAQRILFENVPIGFGLASLKTENTCLTPEPPTPSLTPFDIARYYSNPENNK